MTYRDKSILEDPEKMCEYCCNFDKEHIGMDCTALCKLTMTLAYAEDYGGNCMFYNVPKEQIIVPPLSLNQMVWCESFDGINQCKVSSLTKKADGSFKIRLTNLIHKFVFEITPDKIGKTVFLTKEEAEEKLRELSNNA